MSYKQDKIDDQERRKRFIAKNSLLEQIVGAVPECRYTVDMQFTDVEWSIDHYGKSYDGFEENPDFQRGYVWTLEQQIKYIEAIVKGTVGDTGRTITFNCPDFQRDQVADSDLKGFTVIDGLQRLTAARKFMKGEFRIFNDKVEGGCDANYFDNSRFNFKSMPGFKLNIRNFQYKKEILDFYIAFNDGGTKHTDEEIERVKAMRNDLE